LTSLPRILLYNNGTTPIDLAYASFTNGFEYTFDYPSLIQPGGFYVIARDKVRFTDKYGFAPHAQYGGKLKNGGERLTLESPYQSIIDTVRYNDKNPWPEEANGLGPSAELIHPGSISSEHRMLQTVVNAATPMMLSLMKFKLEVHEPLTSCNREIGLSYTIQEVFI